MNLCRADIRERRALGTTRAPRVDFRAPVEIPFPSPRPLTIPKTRVGARTSRALSSPSQRGVSRTWERDRPGCSPSRAGRLRSLLVAARLLKPLGNPPANGVKSFATSLIIESTVTNAIHTHWRDKNARKEKFSREVAAQQ